MSDQVHGEQRARSLAEEPRFQPDDVLEHRFRIVRTIGQGGMGVIYEAIDQKLERRIALKCAKTQHHRRLTPEVRHATEVSHPNVCKIFEIHTTATPAGDVDFITMEFLEGETLARRLRHGPLPEREARAIALQICAGIAEAHRKGVIHGDLKTSNIILTERSGGGVRAVVTDFGLARALDRSESDGTGPGSGTPGYMSPELWRGAEPSVTSDIYALGVIFYEMLAGYKPHESGEISQSAATATLAGRDDPPEVWEKRLSRKPLPVNPKWDRVLACCLDPDPAARFQSVDRMVQALGPSRTRRWILGGVAAVVVAAISGAITYQQVAAPKETVRLAVLPFEADAAAAEMAQKLLRETEAGIGRIPSGNRKRFKSVSLEGAKQKVDSPASAQAVLGVTHVLRATLASAGGITRVTALVTDARTGLNIREWSADYPPAELRFLPAALAGVVTWSFGLPVPEGAAAIRPGAQSDYRTGRAQVRRVSGLIEAALASFQKAVDADPDSPLTHAGLAEAQWFKYFQTKDRTWLERAGESVHRAQRRYPDLAPVHRIAGILTANAGYYEQAIAEYRRAIELEPANGDNYRRLARVYESSGQMQEASAAYRRAIDLDSGYYGNYLDFGAFYFKLGNFAEALKYRLRAVQLAPLEPGAHFALAADYQNLGRFAEAEEQLRISIGLKETYSAVYTLGYVLMYEGRENEAIPRLERATELSPEGHLPWLLLGIAWRRVHRPGESERANRRGLELAEAAVARSPRNAYERACLAYLCARLGDRRRADSELAQALQLSPQDADVREMAALTYEALVRRDDTFNIAVSLSTEQLARLNEWPDVADLRKDPRFAQLLASRHIK